MTTEAQTAEMREILEAAKALLETIERAYDDANEHLDLNDAADALRAAIAKATR